jgi:hypothetical protein
MLEAINFTFCLRHNEAVQRMRKLAEENDVGTLTVTLQKFLRRPRVDPKAILMAFFEAEAFGAAGEPDRERAFAWLAANSPDLPDLMILRAERAARRGAWREVVDLLAPLTARAEPQSDLCPYHGHHLTVLGFLRLGEPDRATEVLDRIGEVATPCPFPVLRELLTPLPEALTADAWGPDRPFLVQLVGAARHADACFARGDPSAALAALSRDPFATSGEVQTLARLAEAWLLSPEPGDLRGRIHKATALGRFLEAHGVKDVIGRREVPLPGALWNAARLDDVSARAVAWLDAPSRKKEPGEAPWRAPPGSGPLSGRGS